MAAIAWGGDGINRNHLLPGTPPWPWRVKQSLGFIPYTGILEIPIEGQASMPEWVNPSSEQISSGAYLITAELGPALCISLSEAAGALRFQWTDLSTNEAYVGTNWVYVLEIREPPSGSWAPVKGGVWPSRKTEWVEALGSDAPMRFSRLKAELLEE